VYTSNRIVGSNPTLSAIVHQAYSYGIKKWDNPNIDWESKIFTLAIGLALLPATAFIVSFVALTSADRKVLFGSRYQLPIDNEIRTYRLHLPKEKVDRVIIGLDGLGGSGRRFAYYTGLHNVAGQGTVVAYPDPVKTTQPGIKNGWNSGFCCGSGWKSNKNDAKFVLEIVNELKRKYNLSPQRIYLVGFSNGALMAQRLIADYPDMFGGAAIVSGSIGANDARFTPKKPVPVILIHGEKDTIIPYHGGVGSSDKSFSWLSFEETTRAWAGVNGQTAPTTIITYKDIGHQWKDWRTVNFWSKRPASSTRIVDFLSSLQAK
jgi:poly(3-hydroxybutyrate) depolymerase